MEAKFNPWPLGIVVFFILLAAGLASMVVIAATHPDTLVSENYYEQELRYQSQIDGKTRAEQSGAILSYDAAAGKIIVQLPAGQAAEKPVGNIEFYRPSEAELDCAFALAPNASGSQALDISKLAAGAWSVRVKWTVADQDYFLERKIAVLPH
jgi:hypothetical protein